MSIDEWINKENVNIYSGILFSLKKEVKKKWKKKGKKWILSQATTWENLKNIMVSIIS